MSAEALGKDARWHESEQVQSSRGACGGLETCIRVWVSCSCMMAPEALVSCLAAASSLAEGTRGGDGCSGTGGHRSRAGHKTMLFKLKKIEPN